MLLPMNATHQRIHSPPACPKLANSFPNIHDHTCRCIQLIHAFTIIYNHIHAYPLANLCQINPHGQTITNSTIIQAAKLCQIKLANLTRSQEVSPSGRQSRLLCKELEAPTNKLQGGPAIRTPQQTSLRYGAGCNA